MFIAACNGEMEFVRELLSHRFHAAASARVPDFLAFIWHVEIVTRFIDSGFLLICPVCISKTDLLYEVSGVRTCGEMSSITVHLVAEQAPLHVKHDHSFDPCRTFVGAR